MNNKNIYKNILKIALGTVFILLLPLLAMQFTHEVNWNAIDFITLGALLFGTGLIYDLVIKKVKNPTTRTALAIALAATLLLAWVHLAVGLIPNKSAIDATAWKTYENKKYSVSVQYPPTFEVQAYDQKEYFTLQISDPTTRVVYTTIMMWNTESRLEEVKSFFTSPYPKQVSISGNSPEHTVVERTLNGLKGIEQYGFGAEGHSYDDVFMYKNRYVWAVYLNPVIEGRIKEPIELGEPVPDKVIYDRIMASIRISPK